LHRKETPPCRHSPVVENAAALDRTFPLATVRYSPARMPTAEEPLTRDAALEALRPRLLAAARRRLSPQDAEDLTQETLLLLATKYAHVGDASELVALGIGILRRKRADLWRKAARRGEAHAEEPDPGALADSRPLPDARAAGRERLRLLVEAAARLDGRCREVLRRKLLGMSFVEIARELGRPVNTIYSWDLRCHERLRRMLGSRWGFVSGEEER
jgi:RNA polymerase sigma-70 factor (ECF subfamily)